MLLEICLQIEDCRVSGDKISIVYPCFIYHDLDNLEKTDLGRFLGADPSVEMYAWLLLWTNFIHRQVEALPLILYCD